MSQNWKVTKTEMSWKTDVAPRLKCYKNWNFTLTEMIQNLKISSKWNLNPFPKQTLALQIVWWKITSITLVQRLLQFFQMKWNLFTGGLHQEASVINGASFSFSFITLLIAGIWWTADKLTWWKTRFLCNLEQQTLAHMFARR